MVKSLRIVVSGPPSLGGQRPRHSIRGFHCLPNCPRTVNNSDAPLEILLNPSLHGAPIGIGRARGRIGHPPPSPYSTNGPRFHQGDCSSATIVPEMSPALALTQELPKIARVLPITSSSLHSSRHRSNLSSMASAKGMLAAIDGGSQILRKPTLVANLDHAVLMAVQFRRFTVRLSNTQGKLASWA